MNMNIYLILASIVILINLHGTSNAETSIRQQVLPLPQPDKESTIDQRWGSTQSQNAQQMYSSHHSVNSHITDGIADGVMNLTLRITSNLAKYSLFGSQIFSPVSVTSALSLLLLGSNGRTFDELNTLLGFSKYQTSQVHEQFGIIMKDLVNSQPNAERQDVYWKSTNRKDDTKFGRNEQDNNVDSLHKIHIANGVFIQNGISLKPDFKSAVQDTYKSEIQNLDFRNNPLQATSYINQWVNYNTHGKIPEIIHDEINRSVNMIMASALYFKGYWENEFIDSATTEADFFPDGPDGRKLRVKMMGTGGVFPFYEDKTEGYKIIGLPYKEGLTTLYLIQPYDSTRTKLYEFQQKLTPQKIDNIISQMTRKTAILAMPKMKITNSFRMKPLLTDLGIETVFQNGQSDFSLISEAQQYYMRPQISTQQNTLRPSTFQRIPVVRPNIQISFPQRFGDDDEGATKTTTEESRTENSNTKIPEFETTTEHTNGYNNNRASENKRSKRSVTYKVESNIRANDEPLGFKDFVLNKRITKSNPGKKILRNRRQTTNSLQNLDLMRQNQQNLQKPPLFVEDIVHKIDLDINEKGTEGGATTVTYLRRSGTDGLLRADTPFLILIRHDTTKMPLFYGPIYEPPHY